MHSTLGSLADPNAFHDPISINGADYKFLKKALHDMILIRLCEYKIKDGMENKLINCPCHLCVGQEAIAVGVSKYLRKTDKIFGAHRSHAHFLAINRDLFGLFSEVLGKETGASKGMGGSMHLFDGINGFLGSVPIVSATIPIATGAALAAKMDLKDDIAVAYFGDAACEEGAFHESLNLAANMGLPILYVCENNLASSHMHISQRQPSDSMARFAEAHTIPYSIVEGNNVVEVANAANDAISFIRKETKPYFLEMVTYRWSGHVGPTEDSDVGVKRSVNHKIWKNRDPIKRLKIALLDNNLLSEEEFDHMNVEINKSIELCWSNALKAPYPPDEALLERVYAK